MDRRILVGLVLATLVVGMLVLDFGARVVKADGAVYIRADGSIDPPTAPILGNGDVYTLTGNITSNADGIVVERDNIVVDGAWFTLEGARADSSHGILLDGRSNVTVKYTRIKDFSEGIRLESSSNNSIVGNTATNNSEYGVRLGSSSNNSIIGNTIRDNYYGVRLHHSSNNSVNGNTIANSSYYGVRLGSSSNNMVSGNTIAGNARAQYGVQLYASSTYNIVGGNSITSNGDGIELYDSSSYNSIGGNILTDNSDYGIRLIWKSNNNSLNENTIERNYGGIWIESSSNYNSIGENNITNNSYGVGLGHSSNNTFWRNNFDNAVQVNDWTPEYTNFWDNGIEGNYWSNYNGTDADNNGVGDTPLVIGANSLDRYPLMNLIPEFPSLLIPALFIAAASLAAIVLRRRFCSKS